jgi:hypothetical protein
VIEKRCVVVTAWWDSPLPYISVATPPSRSHLPIHRQNVSGTSSPRQDRRQAQPRPRQGGARVDRDRPRRQVPPGRALRRCDPRRHRPLPADQQALPRRRPQDQHLRRTVQDDGEHQQVRLAVSRRLVLTVRSFQAALKAYGVNDVDVFQTVDLWEKKDIGQVTNTIFALGRTTYKHPEWKGPYLGPKPSDENKREFTEEQMRAGETMIGLQAGQNKGASQAGQNMGAGRKIILGK